MAVLRKTEQTNRSTGVEDQEEKRKCNARISSGGEKPNPSFWLYISYYE
jgi:hypothetical protein